MSKTTLYLPGFPVRFGRPRHSSRKKAIDIYESLRRGRLWELEEFLSPWIPRDLLQRNVRGENSRNRAYTVSRVFYGFFFQLLSGSACAETVKQIQSWLQHQKDAIPSSNTSGYCQARKRISLDLVRSIFERIVGSLEKDDNPGNLWYGRKVKVVDGTGLSMPDTVANQKCWPQNGAMKTGCGFPQMKVVGIFNLATGALLGWADGNKHDHENRLWRRLWKLLNPGDILLGDRGFCSYYNITSLKDLGVDTVFRLHQCRVLNWKRGLRLGVKDRLVKWSRPSIPSKGITAKAWKKVPREIQVRIVKVPILIPGFRSNTFTLVTTLTDAKKYTAKILAEIYFQRWQVELFFKDIKTSLGMDILSSKTPEQIRKELVMYFILYNVIRGVMLSASKKRQVPLARISFKGTATQINQWQWLFICKAKSIKEFHCLLSEFYKAITSALIPQRPGRNEPRAKKRRPKNYSILNKPRKKNDH